jgi:hypothetical protein
MLRGAVLCQELILLNLSCCAHSANASDLSNDCGLQERNAMRILALHYVLKIRVYDLCTS